MHRYCLTVKAIISCINRLSTCTKARFLQRLTHVHLVGRSEIKIAVTLFKTSELKARKS